METFWGVSILIRKKWKKKFSRKSTLKFFPFEIMQNLCTQCMKWSILVLFVMWVACLQKNKSLLHFFLLQNCSYSKICIGLSRSFWPHPWGILVNILSSNRGLFFYGYLCKMICFSYSVWINWYWTKLDRKDIWKI